MEDDDDGCDDLEDPAALDDGTVSVIASGEIQTIRTVASRLTLQLVDDRPGGSLL